MRLDITVTEARKLRELLDNACTTDESLVSLFEELDNRLEKQDARTLQKLGKSIREGRR